MTIFKTYLKVLNKNKWVVLLYTIILLVFGGFNMQTSEEQMTFHKERPDITIQNQDENGNLSQTLVDYLNETCNITTFSSEEQEKDALFYRDISAIITIPENYSKEFLLGKNPKLEIQTAGNYDGSFAKMIVERYLFVARSYLTSSLEEDQILSNIKDTLNIETKVNVTAKQNHGELAKVANFYNFSNYSLLAGCIYVICFILSSFKKESIQKRTMISSMNEKKFQRLLLYSNSLFAFTLWLFYVLLSYILIGKAVFSAHGLLCILNSFLFTICATTIAFLISEFVNNKNAINGIVNVVALGSSFLCGAFVPAELLPDFVLNLAHILPSYYFIHNNTIITKIETFSSESLKPVFQNFMIILLFALLFGFIASSFTKKHHKTA